LHLGVGGGEIVDVPRGDGLQAARLSQVGQPAAQAHVVAAQVALELDIDVRGERAQTTPAKLTSVAIIYRINGEGIDRESAEFAIDLALNKYCSVRDSLDPAIPIEWTIVLNEDRPTP